MIELDLQYDRKTSRYNSYQEIYQIENLPHFFGILIFRTWRDRQYLPTEFPNKLVFDKDQSIPHNYSP